MFDEPIWGIDLGSTSVRVVRLARRGASFEIVDVDRIDTYRDPALTSPEELDAALRKALAIFAVNHRIGARDRVGIAIPGLGFETLVLDLPPVADRRLGDLVDYEVRARAGAAASDMIHAFRELPGPSVNERRVLVAMGAAGVVGGYLDAFASAGISADRVVLAPLAFANALQADGLEVRDAVAVRVGVGATDLVVGLREGPLTRTEPEGTLWIARTLRERLGLGVKEAEGERRAIETRQGDPRSQGVAADFAERLVTKIASAIEAGRLRSSAFVPQRILIAGEGARIKGLTETISKKLAIPVEVHAKWNRVAIGKHLFGHALATEVPALTIALGAAIDAAGASESGLSIVPRNRVRETARALPLVGVAVAALVAGTFAGDRFATHAERTIDAAREFTDDAWSQATIREQLVALREQEDGRAASDGRALDLIDDWLVWERATGRLLESLDPDAVVRSARFDRVGPGALRATVTALFPRTGSAGASGDPPRTAAARDFESVVSGPLRTGLFPAPRRLEHRLVAAPRADAPAVSDDGSHAALFDLFRFEVTLAHDTDEPGGSGR